MDTDQRQQNNMQINAFTGGMNTDTQINSVGNTQYVFGQNIRITNNTLLATLMDANSTEGCVTPINVGEDVTIIKHGNISNISEILAVSTIENVGAIIVKHTDNKWSVLRATFDEINNTLDIVKLFTSSKTTDKHRFSVVLNKELANRIKLYIADGLHPLMTVILDYVDDDNRTAEDYYNNLNSIGSNYDNEDLLCSHRIFPDTPIKIVRKITGTLTTQQVQYAYRFYMKNSICSSLSPLTKKIQVVNSNKHKEEGVAQDTSTSIGFQLKIDVNNAVYSIFDYVQVYRLSYIKPGDNAKINLIYDAKINKQGVIINDSGLPSLQELTIDEFSSLDGQTLIPQLLQQSQSYLFEANVDDQSELILSSESFDTRSYSCDHNGNYKLYKDSYDKTGKQYTDYSNIDNEYDVNKSSDINSDIASISYLYNKSKNIGGNGINVDWELIVGQVPLHYDYTLIGDDYPNIDDLPTFDPKMGTFGYNNQASKDASFDQVIKQIGLEEHVNLSYDDVFTSSLMRSLRRDEVYRYGIVFYDKYGRRTQAQWIADIRTPKIKDCPIVESVTTSSGKKVLCARPLGIRFTVKKPQIEGIDVVGYEIVKCEKKDSYSRILSQYALATPVRQQRGDDEKDESVTVAYSPYYPTGFLTSVPLTIHPGYGDVERGAYGPAQSNIDSNLYQLFNPEIQISRSDELTRILNNNCVMHSVSYAYNDTLDSLNDALHDPSSYVYLDNPNKGSAPYWHDYFGTTNNKGRAFAFTEGVGLVLQRPYLKFDKNSKNESSYVFKNYNFDSLNAGDTKTITLNAASDVKQPTWENGFSDHQFGGNEDYHVISAIKQYKSYLTGMNDITYNNWASCGMYDLRVSSDETQSGVDNTWDGYSSRVRVFTSANETLSGNDNSYGTMKNVGYRRGWIGPGPQCLIAKFSDNIYKVSGGKSHSVETLSMDITALGTRIINIVHTAQQFAGHTANERQYDIYYGFGNYCKFTGSVTSSYVFDGDIYIIPAEIVSLFKAYDFNSVADTLFSTQVIYYVPMESKINTFFDYGMNYRNTQGRNLQLEPGDIEGVSSQERPLHQYNMIYSDNTTSNNIFNAQSSFKSQQDLPQRIVYSGNKINGELIDSWHTFKAVDFIDTDTRYGDITYLLTYRDILYYWQTNAFGKLSVNERSLIKDENSNTIQLGQGGVLQRTDYIDTNYGMRYEDFSAVSANGAIYWIDIINKAIVCFTGDRVGNLSESLNVQNYINENISYNIPNIDYDLQNNELLCQCLTKGNQIVFSLKLGVATSIYTRDYHRIINYKNILLSLDNTCSNSTRYNYIGEHSTSRYLTPLDVSVVINSDPSTTKVFDNQKIVVMKKKRNTEFNKQYSFTTDIYDKFTTTMKDANITDREGNLLYAIPRYDNSNYGNRIRGQWMRMDIVDNDPKYDFAISHILTKFRQSHI